ncbi:MAG: tryptophan-rich sensory protein [Beijerinckiaceae bacterium]|jgi:tryptophan-rich sensory protein|nr:tryptophan-rich sensory protein [Beijerinckiaceae bacterium]
MQSPSSSSASPAIHPAMSLRGIVLLPVSVLPSLFASVLGQLFTAVGMVGWYRTLQKPFFNPPDLAFPIAWTFLYALMAVAFWRILRLRSEAGPKGMAILAYLGQMLLNVGWSYVFFGLRSPLGGLVVSSAMLIAIGITIRYFQRLDRAAGIALYPYFAWVTFATVLNATIVWLNPGA